MQHEIKPEELSNLPVAAEIFEGEKKEEPVSLKKLGRGFLNNLHECCDDFSNTLISLWTKRKARPEGFVMDRDNIVAQQLLMSLDAAGYTIVKKETMVNVYPSVMHRGIRSIFLTTPNETLYLANVYRKAGLDVLTDDADAHVFIVDRFMRLVLSNPDSWEDAIVNDICEARKKAEEA